MRIPALSWQLMDIKQQCTENPEIYTISLCVKTRAAHTTGYCEALVVGHGSYSEIINNFDSSQNNNYLSKGGNEKTYWRD
jgi:hypothetical protein